MEEKNYLLQRNELIYILTGIMTGVGILSLPNDLVKAAGQDGWISAILGGIYPTFVVTCGVYLHKKYPKDNILVLSENYFGKIIGKSLNIIFMLYLFVAITSATAGLSNIVKIYILTFEKSSKIISVAILLSVYASYCGLKAISKINIITFYLSLILIILPMAAFKEGLLLNVKPILAATPVELIKGSLNSAYSYLGIEIFLVLYSNVSGGVSIKKQGYIAVLTNIGIYTWITFITIYYLGINIIPKNIWSFVIVTESLILPTISTFRFVFMFFWVIIIFKTIANGYYVVSYIGNSVFKIDRKKICIIIYPVAVALSLWFGNEINRRNIMGVITPYLVIFNIIYILLIVTVTLYKNSKIKKI